MNYKLLLQALTTQLERAREKEGMLCDEEREMMLTVQKDRDQLEQLQRDVNWSWLTA